MLYYAVEGKYFGELAGNVSERTDVYVWRSGDPPFRVDEKLLEDKIFSLCQRLQPRVLSQTHVDILNGLGAAFGGIPKLKTKKVEGELAIS
jgi:hypothetical protein